MKWMCHSTFICETFSNHCARHSVCTSPRCKQTSRWVRSCTMNLSKGRSRIYLYWKISVISQMGQYSMCLLLSQIRRIPFGLIGMIGVEARMISMMSSTTRKTPPECTCAASSGDSAPRAVRLSGLPSRSNRCCPSSSCARCNASRSKSPKWQ